MLAATILTPLSCPSNLYMMGVFEEADPQLIWKAIEGYTDALSEPAQEQSELYRKYRCPRCRCGLQKEFDPRVGWKDTPLPQFLLKCDNCGYMIDPSTDMVIQYGNASKVPTPDYIPIVGKE
jgi:rubredoxin